jgi:RNA polymerase sigma-70 factor, ECF subfamily
MAEDPDANTLLSAVAEARARFMSLVAEIRPELFRYCARMTGSVFDGEDVVQDALAKAYYALGQMTEVPPLRPWLFRIAHNTAMDFLKRYERKHVELAAEVPVATLEQESSVDPALLEAAICAFVDLPPVQRSALVLKDVLGHSLEACAQTMGTSVSAVKAALVRARSNVAVSAGARRASSAQPTTDEHLRRLQRYADLFNARDWDGLRALLGQESRLDLVSRAQRRGAAVSDYFLRYSQISPQEDLRAEPGLVDGVPAVAIFRPSTSTAPAYFVLLEWDDHTLTFIRDYHYVPYIGEGADFIPSTRT